MSGAEEREEKKEGDSEALGLGVRLSVVHSPREGGAGALVAGRGKSQQRVGYRV